MNLSAIFIRRPVMTTLLMVAFILAGLFGYAQLPISELPAVDFPTISVSASLPGADAETMASAVATPLESQFSTIPGISNMTSQSTQGSTSITLQFELDRNIDAAAQDVQSAISAATRSLPTNMPAPPSMRKVNPADSPILYIAMSSATLPISTVDEYAEATVIRRLSTLDGVAQVLIYGQAKPAVRIQVDPDALAARGIGIDQVATAINNANVNLATGQFDGATRGSVIHTEGQLTNAAAFAPQIIAYHNGAPVRFADVATLLDSVENNKLSATYNGSPSVILAVQRQPGANTIDTVDEVMKALPGLRAEMPPSVHLDVTYDRSQSIRASVSDVQLTLLVAGLLVVAVIFIFLRTASATIIPSLAMPISVIGTFAFMAFFGYSLDNLSLMALTLCVGFIVDDAIVMLENIMRHVEAGERPFDAAMRGSREIGFTILSMTLSLAAVFIPVLFMGGIVGRLLHEFAVTIVIAILVSGFVSITLTPMLCSRVLKAATTHGGEHHNWFYRLSENTFQRVQERYERSLKWSVAHRTFITVLFFVSLIATGLAFYYMPTDFLPAEDTGQIQVTTEAINGISFADMNRHQMEAVAVVRANPNVQGLISAVGSGGPRAGVNQGSLRIVLKPMSQRNARGNIDVIMADLRKALARIPGMNAYPRNPPSINIGASQSKALYQYALVGLDQNQLYAFSQRLKNAVAQDRIFTDVTSDLDLSTPSVNVAINRDRAAALGISPAQIETALGSSFGGQQVSTIYTPSDQFHVILELQPRFQRDSTALSRLYLTSSQPATATPTSGSASTLVDAATSTATTAPTGSVLVPLTSVTTITRGTQPLSVNHLGQLPAVTLSFNLVPGVALSAAVEHIGRIQDQVGGLPAGIQGSFQGQAQAFQQSTSGMGILLLGAIIVVYIVLGILYESFVHPLTILSGLPSAAVGALITLWLFGFPLSLYAFVGMIMLVGIVKKNAIMMIDFALNRQRAEGVDADTAIVEAATIRFRPIMMTTMAALMGTLPIALGIGAGGAGRQPLGLAVVGGLVLSQALTLYITPVLYGYLDRFGMWAGGRGHRRGREHPAPVAGE